MVCRNFICINKCLFLSYQVDIVVFCNFFSWAARNRKRFGNFLWTSLWCKAVSYAWCSHAKSYAGCYTYVHSYRCPLVLYWANLQKPQTRPRNRSMSGTIFAVVDSEHFPLRTSSVPTQILANSEQHLAFGYKYWDYYFCSCSCMLDFEF